MSDDDKQKKVERAAELNEAIRKHDDGKKRASEQLDRLLSSLDAVADGMKSFSTRLDTLESEHLRMRGSGHRASTVVPTDGGSPPRSPLSNGPADSNAPVRSPFSTGDDHGKPREPGEPRPTVADSDDDAIFGRGHKQPLFWERQSAADQACRAWGAAAVPPLHGEQLLDYRRRLLRPLMKHSKEFAAVDLDELREPLLGPIEKSVFADAIRASTDASSVPEDYLREIITVDKTGRRISSFVGQPRAWMNAFACPRRRLIGIRNTSSP
jgi:hypothetical protein